MDFFSKRVCNIKHFFDLFGWAKKVNRMPFFFDFSRKNHCSHAHILPKKRPFSKKHDALMPIFSQKTSILSQKHGSLMSFFFFMKTPCCHAHIWSKSQFCQNYTILWPKKVNRMPFFSDFSRKNHLSHAHIWSKKRPFSKKHNALMPTFCPKNVYSLNNTVLSCHFFIIFHEKPPSVMPIFGKKT